MKSIHLVISLLAFATWAVSGATSSSTPQTSAGAASYSITESGGNYNNWQKTNSDGTVHKVVELATGLNYTNSLGVWTPSREEIDGYSSGAIAQFGQHKVIFANNLNTVGAIDLQMPDGKEMQSDILGIEYYDTSSGNSVLIAETKDCQGQIVQSNQVVYSDAFNGVSANVSYRYTKAGLEQDVILLAQLPPPENFGLSSASSVLQVLTEFTAAPQPQVKTNTAAFRGLNLPDESLNFGSMRMLRGRGFLLGTNSIKTPIGRQWITVNGRSILIESMPLTAVAKALAQLPAFSSADPKRPEDSPLYAVSTKRLLPAPKIARLEKGEMKLAAGAPPEKGLVLDYVVVLSPGNYSDYTFQGATYFISGPVDCFGPTTLGPSVIKFPNNTAAYILISDYAYATSVTSPYKPCILTAGDDNSVGEPLNTSIWPGYTGTINGTYANPALYFEEGGSTSDQIGGLRICFANEAIFSLSSQNGITLSDSQIIRCGKGISLSDNGNYGATGFVTLDNCLIAECGVALAGGGNGTTFHLYNCTIDEELGTSGDDGLALGNIYAVNCIFSNPGALSSDTLSGGYNAVAGSAQIGDHPIAFPSNPFNYTCAGLYYLNAPTLMGAGTSDPSYVLDQTVLAKIATRTTRPPTSLGANQTTTLGPTTTGDTNSTPDLGYHYDRLDYVVDNRQLTTQINADLTFSAGTIVGWLEEGLPFSGRYTLNFDGTVAKPCYFVACTAVQDQELRSAGVGITDASGTDSPTVNATFTRFWAMDNEATFFDSTSVNVNANSCEFWNGQIGGNNTSGLSLNLFNCLLDNTITSIQDGSSGNCSLQLQNCTQIGGKLQITRAHSAWPITIQDCAFDGVTDSLSDSEGGGAITGGYNARSQNSTWSGGLPTCTCDITGVSSFNWQAGPLGNFYLPAPPNSPLVNANNATGDPLAKTVGTAFGLGGLSDYTTQTALSGSPPKETREGPTSPVDIGYHYVAVDANTNALDSNGDGVPDYWADMYGLDPNAAAGSVDSASGDADGDGISNLQEYQAGTSPVENDGLANPLALPPVGARYLRIISPTVLELVRVMAGSDNTWNYGGTPPGVGSFQVNGGTPASVGFKRRPLYQSYTDNSDTRIENSIYLTLSTAINDNTIVQVQKAGTWSSTDWPDNVQFISHADPLRYGPAIHVNQDGYLPNQSKKAKIGYYLGSLGEILISASQFSIVDAATGASVYTGNLTARGDTGWNTGQEQYQHVLEADFSTFQTPGTYRLQVPGLGVSFPFDITNSIALKWARTYALGLYHQRCGSGANGLQVNDMPYTRFIHNDCHVANAYVPKTSTSWPDPTSVQFYNGRLTDYNYPACGGSTILGYKDSCQTATAMCTFENSLFPLPASQQVPASGGHHDAGDYSKYVPSCALLLHTLTFAADNIPGAANLNDLGLPESGDTYGSNPVHAFSDLLQEAKWEADFLIKMQDNTLINVGGQMVPDGGFYFLVYPTGNSEYESWTPDRNQGQLIFPKNTAATAAAVAALAEIGSSPAFKARYSQQANLYLTAAINGWNFLNRALANQGAGQWPYGGAYQTIIGSFGGYYMHQDSLLWAAAAMFAAGQVGGQNGVVVDPHTKFLAWLDAQPSQTPSGGVSAQTWHYGYGNSPCIAPVYPRGIPNDFGPLFSGFGCAFRDYVFAGRSRGLALNSDALRLCEDEILDAGQFWRTDSAHTSYGTSFDDALKETYNASFYFSTDPAFALAVSDALVTTLTSTDPAYDATYAANGGYVADHAANVEAILENFNFQHGCNPVNVSFVTGLGWKRQRQIVYQEANYPNYDVRLLPPAGVPLGNLSSGFAGQESDLNAYFYPAAPGTGASTYALYDRWGDAHNVNRELTSFRIANALGAAAYLHSLSGAASPAWNNSPGYFTFLGGTPTTNVPTVVRLDTTDSSVNLDNARITWDVDSGDQPAFGRAFTLKPRTTIGDTLVEAEAVLPDGRRVFGRQYVHFRPSSGGQEFTLPDANTVALYHFNDAQFPPTTLDSANGYNLIKSGGFPDLVENNSWMATASSSYRAARFGAIGDQIASSVTIPYGSLPGGSTGLTIEFRLYVKRLPYLGSALTLFSFTGQPPGNSSSEWSIKYRTDLAPYPYFQAPNDHVVPDDSQLESSAIWAAKMTPNTWHAVKITATAAGVTSVYIDDMANAVASANKPVNWNVTTWQLSMGNFIGCIDELRISKGVR